MRLYHLVLFILLAPPALCAAADLTTWPSQYTLRPWETAKLTPADVVGPARPGASFAYVTDTQPCDGGMALAEQADLMYHEATFRQSDVDRARETRHATALEAAGVAREAGARQLLLGHFSARYDGADLRALLEEARTVFQNTEAAEELKRYSVAPPDANIPATIPWSSVVPERPE